MKFLLAAVPVLLLSSVVFAIPAVGDYAKYSLNMTVNGQVLAGTLEETLTAYDPASDSFTEQIVVTDQNGNAQTQLSTTQRSQLLNDAVLGQLPAVCAQAGGSLGSTTVPAGTFNTCNVPASNGSTGNVWIGDVPFGIVQANVADSSSGTTTALALLAYTTGTGAAK